MFDVKYLIRKRKERKNLYKASPVYKTVQKKMSRSLFLNDVLNRPQVFRIELINTLQCNAVCKHCSNYKLSEDHKVMTEETFQKILEQAIFNKTPSISFLGGEALMDSNLFSYLERVVAAGIGCGVSTNALAVDRAILERIKKTGAAGVGSTIYDAVPENHDSVVGVRGAFNKIFQVREMAREVGLGFSMQSVYSREGLQTGAINRLINMCRKNNYSLKFNLIMPVGRSASEKQMLNEAEITQFKDLLQSDARFSSHCIFNKEPERCPMGRTYLGITPKGDMMPCYFMPISLGNVHNTSFAEYLEYARTFPIFRKEGLPKGFCIVAESKRFFREILEPLYQSSTELPVELRKNRDWEKKIRQFRL